MQEYNVLKQHTARLSIYSNILLVCIKIIVGLYTGAVSIVSEAAHSAVDLLAAVVAFFAVRKSSIPPDAEHAYGHGKYEDISAAFEAILIIVAAVWIVIESLQKLKVGTEPELLEYGMIVMGVSIIINYFVSARLYKVAKLTSSNALEADALHLRADIWTSLGVLLGLVLIKVTGLTWLDPLIAIVVAAVIFKAGYSMTKKSLYELMDTSLPSEEEQVIKDVFNNHPEVISFHRLRTRRAGSNRLIDVHVILYKDTPLNKAHAISDALEAEIEEQLGNCDVIIHLEPCDHTVISE